MFKILFALLLSSTAYAQQGIFTDYVRLQPTSLPALCNPGDLRYDTVSHTICNCGLSNNWTSFSVSSTAPLTTLGDTMYEDITPQPTRLPGNTTTTKKYYSQTGTGSVSAPPSWSQISTGDLTGTLGTGFGGTGLSTPGISGNILQSNGTIWTSVANPSSNPMTTLGDMMFENATPAAARLPGSISATKNFLTQTGNGTISATPAWGLLASGDIPNNAANTTGTSSNITGTTNATLTSLTALATASALTSVGTIATGTWNATTVATAHGGTGQASVIIAPTASTYAGWDANKNFSANAYIPGFTTTATAAGTTTLTIASTQTQYFTGVTTQTVKLPTTSVAAGTPYLIDNRSTGVVTVQSSGANTIQAMAANTQLLVTALVATPTTAANWDAVYASQTISSGSGISLPTSEVFVTSGTGFGTTNLNVRIFTTVSKNTGTDITYATSATLGDSFTINTTGVYAMTYYDGGSGIAGSLGLTKNGTALSTSPFAITIAQGKIAASATTTVSTGVYPVGTTLNCTATDIIRVMADPGAVENGSDNVTFRITRVD